MVLWIIFGVFLFVHLSPCVLAIRQSVGSALLGAHAYVLTKYLLSTEHLLPILPCQHIRVLFGTSVDTGSCLDRSVQPKRPIKRLTGLGRSYFIPRNVTTWASSQYVIEAWSTWVVHNDVILDNAGMWLDIRGSDWSVRPRASNVGQLYTACFLLAVKSASQRCSQLIAILNIQYVYIYKRDTGH